MSRLFQKAVLIGFFFIVGTSCTNKQITREDTINNYEKNSIQIMELAAYFWKLKPDSNEIFFKPSKNVYTISIAQPGWAISPDKPYNAGRDMLLASDEMKTYLKTLGWTTNTIRSLKKMLNASNCLSISTHGDYLQLDFGADDICSFSYIINERPFPDSIIENDSKQGITFLSNYVRIGRACAL
jgi:hypothetical protein